MNMEISVAGGIMTNKEIKDIIFAVLVDIGALNCCEINDVPLTNTNLEDVDLRKYVVDSLMFITFIVQLEKALNIYFPDDLLYVEKLASLNGFSILLEEIYIESRKAE